MDEESGEVKEIQLTLWDTAGQEIFESMAEFYYRQADAAIIVYDVSNEASFDKCYFWAQ